GCLGLIILILVIGSLLPDSKNSSPPPASPIAPPPEPGSDFKAKQVAEQLIEDWKRGELGTEYWKDGLPEQTLYARTVSVGTRTGPDRRDAQGFLKTDQAVDVRRAARNSQNETLRAVPHYNRD